MYKNKTKRYVQKLLRYTYVHVYSGPREHSGVRQFLRHIPEELLSALVPFDRVQRIGFQVVCTREFGRMAGRHGRGYRYAHVRQTVTFCTGNREINTLRNIIWISRTRDAVIRIFRRPGNKKKLRSFP